MSSSNRDSPKATSPYKNEFQNRRYACNRCHARKLRCPREETTTDSGPCLRCVRATAECTYSPPLRMGRRAGQKNESFSVNTTSGRKRAQTSSSEPPVSQNIVESPIASPSEAQNDAQRQPVKSLHIETSTDFSVDPDTTGLRTNSDDSSQNILSLNLDLFSSNGLIQADYMQSLESEMEFVDFLGPASSSQHCDNYSSSIGRQAYPSPVIPPNLTLVNQGNGGVTDFVHSPFHIRDSSSSVSATNPPSHSMTLSESPVTECNDPFQQLCNLDLSLHKQLQIITTGPWADVLLSSSSADATACRNAAIHAENNPVTDMLASSQKFVDVLGSFITSSRSLNENTSSSYSSDAGPMDEIEETNRPALSQPKRDIPTVLLIITCYIHLVRIENTIIQYIHRTLFSNTNSPSSSVVPMLLSGLLPGLQLDIGTFPAQSNCHMQIFVLIQVVENMLDCIENALGVSGSWVYLASKETTANRLEDYPDLFSTAAMEGQDSHVDNVLSGEDGDREASTCQVSIGQKRNRGILGDAVSQSLMQTILRQEEAQGWERGSRSMREMIRELKKLLKGNIEI